MYRIECNPAVTPPGECYTTDVDQRKTTTSGFNASSISLSKPILLGTVVGKTHRGGNMASSGERTQRTYPHIHDTYHTGED